MGRRFVFIKLPDGRDVVAEDLRNPKKSEMPSSFIFTILFLMQNYSISSYLFDVPWWEDCIISLFIGALLILVFSISPMIVWIVSGLCWSIYIVFTTFGYDFGSTTTAIIIRCVIGAFAVMSGMGFNFGAFTIGTAISQNRLRRKKQNQGLPSNKELLNEMISENKYLAWLSKLFWGCLIVIAVFVVLDINFFKIINW